MDMSYFQKINNMYQSSSRQETDLFELNRHVNNRFADTIDYHEVTLNGKPFELIITRIADIERKKSIKSRPGHYFSLGDIVDWNGSKWLIAELDPDDKTYLRGTMWLCNMRLVWKKDTGDIITRYCFGENLTKYSSGVTGYDEIKNAYYQYGLTITYDDETRILRRDKRFCIDDSDIVPPETYKITNREIFLNNFTDFNRGGLVNLTLSYDEYNKSTDKVIVLPDGTKVWCADYLSSSDDTPLQTVSAVIKWSGRKIIIAGGNYKKFSVDFKDKNGEILKDLTPVWSVTALPSFEKYISTIIDEHSDLLIKADYTEEIMTQHLRIDVSDKSGNYHSSITVQIGGGI